MQSGAHEPRRRQGSWAPGTIHVSTQTTAITHIVVCISVIHTCTLSNCVINLLIGTLTSIPLEQCSDTVHWPGLRLHRHVHHSLQGCGEEKD